MKNSFGKINIGTGQYLDSAVSDDDEQRNEENSLTNNSTKDKNIQPNRPQQNEKLEPEGWMSLKEENQDYCQRMLSSHLQCLECIERNNNKFKPHCLCSLITPLKESNDVGYIKNCCSSQCPIGHRECKTKKNTSKGENVQQSHCPTCLCISPGITHHPSYSSVIEPYICAKCEGFYKDWSKKDSENNWSSWKNFKCVNFNGRCFEKWAFDDEIGHNSFRCTWCRMKLMQRLGFDMNDNLQHALQSPDFGFQKRKAINTANSNIRKRKTSKSSYAPSQLPQNSSNYVANVHQTVEEMASLPYGRKTHRKFIPANTSTPGMSAQQLEKWTQLYWSGTERSETAITLRGTGIETSSSLQTIPRNYQLQADTQITAGGNLSCERSNCWECKTQSFSHTKANYTDQRLFCGQIAERSPLPKESYPVSIFSVPSSQELATGLHYQTVEEQRASRHHTYNSIPNNASTTQRYSNSNVYAIEMQQTTNRDVGTSGINNPISLKTDEKEINHFTFGNDSTNRYHLRHKSTEHLTAPSCTNQFSLGPAHQTGGGQWPSGQQTSQLFSTASTNVAATHSRGGVIGTQSTYYDYSPTSYGFMPTSYGMETLTRTNWNTLTRPSFGDGTTAEIALRPPRIGHMRLDGKYAQENTRSRATNATLNNQPEVNVNWSFLRLPSLFTNPFNTIVKTLIGSVSNLFISSSGNEASPSEYAKKEGTILLPAAIKSQMLINLNNDISAIMSILGIKDPFSKIIERIREVNLKLLVEKYGRCACGANTDQQKLLDPSHFIADLLIHIGWILPVPEAERGEFVPDQNQYINNIYGVCCNEGRFTSAQGFQYLVDTGKINPSGRRPDLFNQLTPAFRELAPNVNQNEYWRCDFCFGEYERNAAHLLAHFLYKLGMLKKVHMQVENGQFSTAGCLEGYQFGLPIRVKDLLKFFVSGVYTRNFVAFSDGGFDLFTNEEYKEIVNPAKYGEKDRIKIHPVKDLPSGEQCFIICIRAQDLERSCNFGTVSECLIGSVGFQGFERFYFTMTEEYFGQLKLNMQSQQVGIGEIEQISAEITVTGGIQHEWEMVYALNDYYVEETTENPSFYMVSDTDEYNQSQVSHNEFCCDENALSLQLEEPTDNGNQICSFIPPTKSVTPTLCDDDYDSSDDEKEEVELLSSDEE